MARYAILNTVDWQGCQALSAGQVPEEQVMERLSGCAWLFRVRDGVECVEDAARAAVGSFFASEEGRRVAQDEGFEQLKWEDAISWVSDEAWAEFGLERIRHPDVERVLLDAAEDLLARDAAAASGFPRASR
jgi:hypothetical protein